MADWIIIVDNDISSLRIAENILIKAGKRVTTLKSGRELLAYIRENGYPDLILMDTDIPELDGFETLQLLKKSTNPGKDVDSVGAGHINCIGPCCGNILSQRIPVRSIIFLIR